MLLRSLLCADHCFHTVVPFHDPRHGCNDHAAGSFCSALWAGASPEILPVHNRYLPACRACGSACFFCRERAGCTFDTVLRLFARFPCCRLCMCVGTHAYRIKKRKPVSGFLLWYRNHVCCCGAVHSVAFAGTASKHIIGQTNSHKLCAGLFTVGYSQSMCCRLAWLSNGFLTSREAVGEDPYGSGRLRRCSDR